MSHPDTNGLADRKPIEIGVVWNNPVTGERATILERPWDNPAGRAHGLASPIFRRPDYVLAKFRVAVQEQEPVCSRVRPCFPHLLDDPPSTRISRDAVAKDLAPV